MADKVRLIDASKIEIFLHQMRYAAATHGMDYDVEIINIILETVEHEPTIEAEPVNGWISVEERLPKIGEHYRSKLVMCYSPDGEHECLFDYYEVNGFGQGCFTAEKYFGISITHWRHLPEPPKGE